MSKEEAQQFGIKEEERRGFVRYDDAKVNLLPAGSETRWFQFKSVPLDNPDSIYVDGDFIGVAVLWEPPPAFAGTDMVTLNLVLDKIAAGIDTPKGNERYSAEPNAKDRAAWRAVQEFYPGKTEAQCRNIITQWLKNELLRKEGYHSPNARKLAQGLTVDDTKRP
jgi:hypothetical protein